MDHGGGASVSHVLPHIPLSLGNRTLTPYSFDLNFSRSGKIFDNFKTFGV